MVWSLQAGEGCGEMEEVAPVWFEANTFTPIILNQLRERAKEIQGKEGISESCGA